MLAEAGVEGQEEDRMKQCPTWLLPPTGLNKDKDKETPHT